MKLLWVKSGFLHPTTKGGHIRSLEMLRRLHTRHEIHYVGFNPPGETEGPRRSAEYCSRAHPVPLRLAPKTSPLFYLDLIAGLLDPLPVAVGRYRSRAMRDLIARLRLEQRFDRIVCDFLVPAPNITALSDCVLFQHNVETTIWRRHLEEASNPLHRLYFRLQTARMFRFERRVCRTVRHVVAVSAADASRMKEMFGVTGVSQIPTGVDPEYFAPPPAATPVADLIFIGSMDWIPNIDGVAYFVREILPLIRNNRPATTLAIVGRDPAPSIQALARQDPRIRVTGTVPDVRPYLWGSAISIVPIRVGGGTRLKIYESMAASTAVVSTTIGAEGLEVRDPDNICIADTPGTFAARCVYLLENPARRAQQAAAARDLVVRRFSWDHVAACFEEILTAAGGRA